MNRPALLLPLLAFAPLVAARAEGSAADAPAEPLRGAAACLAELPGGPDAKPAGPNEADRFFEALVRLETEAWATDGRPSRASWLALLDAALACPPDVGSSLAWDFAVLPGTSYGVSDGDRVSANAAFDALLPLLPPPREWPALRGEVESRLAAAADAASPPPLLVGLRAAFARLAGDEAAATNALAALPAFGNPPDNPFSTGSRPDPDWRGRYRAVLATNSPLPALRAAGGVSPFASREDFLAARRAGDDDRALRDGAGTLASLVRDALDRGDAAAAEALADEFVPGLPPEGWERLALFAESSLEPIVPWVDGPDGRSVRDPAWPESPAAAAWRAFLAPRLTAPGVATGNPLFRALLAASRSADDVLPVAEAALRAAGGGPAASTALAVARLECAGESGAPAALDAALSLVEARLASAPDLPPRPVPEWRANAFGEDFPLLLSKARDRLFDLARRRGGEDAVRGLLRRFVRVAAEIRARDPEEDFLAPRLLDACIEAGLFEEAEELAVELLRRGPQIGCFYYEWDAPGLAAKLYLRAGRPADALAVFAEFPGWNRGDVAAFDSASVEARTLEAALEAVGRGEEAARVRAAFAARDEVAARREALARETVADWPDWWERAIAAMPSAEAFRAEREIFPLETSRRVLEANSRVAPPAGLRAFSTYTPGQRALAAALEAAASGRTAGPLRKGHGFVVRPSRLLPGRAAFRSFGDVYETLRREERRRERRAEDAERK